jgi:hypothetical protein
MIELFVPTVVQRLTEILPAALSEKDRKIRSVEVARRALALELDRNLSVIRSCLRDPSGLSAKDAPLIRALVRRLDVSIAITLYTEWSAEIDFVAALDEKTEKVLKSILKEKPLPGPSAKRQGKEIKASDLLDFIARKVPEMQIIDSLAEDPDFKPLCRLDWPKRIQNLTDVMKALLQALRA